MVQRFDVGARLSEMAVHNSTCWLAGQVAADSSQDISGQTRQVLAAIDALLARAGTDKSKILMCQIYIKDLAEFQALNAVWEAWVAPGPCPATCHGGGPFGQARVEGGDGGHRSHLTGALRQHLTHDMRQVKA